MRNDYVDDGQAKVDCFFVHGDMQCLLAHGGTFESEQNYGA